jgi:hypothetical protein
VDGPLQHCALQLCALQLCQHWVLDVAFAEDTSRIRKGAGPEISAALRRMALNSLQRDTSIKENIRGQTTPCRMGRERPRRHLRWFFS